MNWLAHAALSPAEPEVFLGNLLGDFPRPSDLSPGNPWKAGVDLHHRIDRFTDSHPAVRMSRARLRSSLRRASGVLVDLFYDHFLTRNWARFRKDTLPEFLRRRERSVAGIESLLPEAAAEAWESMKEEKLLSRYGTVEGITEVIVRLQRRRPGSRFASLPLHLAADDLRDHHAELETDFLAFYPDCQEQVNGLNRGDRG